MMKKLKIYPYRLTIKALFILALFTTACAPSAKDADRNTDKVKSENTIEKPKVDINTAVVMGDLDAVKQHIKAGTDINQKEAMSSATPLMSAVTFNKPEIVKALIDANADLHVKNNEGSTALHTAAFFGRIEIVQMLIDANADKTIKNKYGATPRETVIGDFEEIKPIYDMLVQQLQPMGFTLDMEELKEARPVVAMMLN